MAYSNVKMARMHSRAKGKAGSKRPAKRTKPSWVSYSAKETEMLIVKLAKEGKTAAQVGLYLRDNYGIPDVKKVINKKITDVLKEKELLPNIPDDLMALIKKNISIKKHIERNKKDMTARHGLELADSKIRRMVKYYKRTGKLAANWKYEPDKIRLLIE